MLKIESTKAVIEFELKGAQMTSFKLKEREFEYLWQPQEGFWQGRNPILFPMVGSTADKLLHIDGEEYSIGNHGFARNMNFETLSQSENSIIFRLSDTEETRVSYPYSFTLDVTYTLVQNEVVISYEISNHSDKMMPFTFGLHPAFTCPFDVNQELNDTYLEFSNGEKDTCLSEIEWVNDKKICLSEKMFEEVQTLIFENPHSSYVEMHDGQHGVRVSCVGYPLLAFWKQPESKFVCIEPWLGRGDIDGRIVEFKDRYGMIHLEPTRSYTIQYTVQVF